jgi:hypothetical protein
MRGVPQANVFRLPSPVSGLPWSSRIIRLTREMRRRERLETLERLHRAQRDSVRRDSLSPDLSRQWLRRF